MGKLGMIGFPTNSGLGTLSLEFFDHLAPYKTLLVNNVKYQMFPERFTGSRSGVTSENIDWLLEGITTLLMFETPVEWSIIKKARQRGILTVLVPMYECTPQQIPVFPDVILCPSRLDYDIFKKEAKEKSKVFELDIPINRKKLPFSPRKRARVFRHHAGHGGLYARNGTSELLAAIPMCQSDATFVIYSQKRIDFTHPKVEMRIGNIESYQDVWRGDGDVFLFPHKFDGLSLPIQEALSVGMPVLSTAMYPFTMWLPNDWFFTAKDHIEAKVFQRYINYAIVEPSEIAKKIDEWYNKDITQDSLKANVLAEKKSWKNLLQLWKKALQV